MGVCKKIKSTMNVPILMFTARDDEVDKILGLELGEDDYVTKPFSVRELIARIKANLRKTESNVTSTQNDDNQNPYADSNNNNDIPFASNNNAGNPYSGSSGSPPCR